MTFLDLFKRFLNIFKSKLSRSLDELDTIQLRCRRIKESYEEAVIKLDATRASAEANVLKYVDKVSEANKKIAQNEATMLRASDANDTDAVNTLNADLEALESNLVILQETLESFQEQVADLDEQALDLQAEIRQAEHTLSLAEIRYQSAKDLMDSNGIMTDSLRKQIEEVRKDADDMSYRYKGARKVREKSKPKADAVRKKYSAPSLSAAERIQAIRDKQAGTSKPVVE